MDLVSLLRVRDQVCVEPGVEPERLAAGDWNWRVTNWSQWPTSVLTEGSSGIRKRIPMPHGSSLLVKGAVVTARMTSPRMTCTSLSLTTEISTIVDVGSGERVPINMPDADTFIVYPT